VFGKRRRILSTRVVIHLLRQRPVPKQTSLHVAGGVESVPGQVRARVLEAVRAMVAGVVEEEAVVVVGQEVVASVVVD
jgi:hypothetical protein